ncbi:MAG: HD domain-containing protein [Gemmatimonadales bacterium]
MTGLPSRFSTLVRRAGATRDPTPLGDALIAAWSEPGRHYHDVRHLEDCLTQLDDLEVDRATRDILEMALWFHDAVYEPRATDNEERSARWAAEGLAAAGVPTAAVMQVVRLVRLTHAHGPASDEAGRLMCDIDLSILGRPAEVFDEYERRIRAEYAWVPEVAFRHGRTRILEGLLQRVSLFQTETFRRRFESSARSNLHRALAALAGRR